MQRYIFLLILLFGDLVIWEYPFKIKKGGRVSAASIFKLKLKSIKIEHAKVHKIW